MFEGTPHWQLVIMGELYPEDHELQLELVRRRRRDLAKEQRDLVKESRRLTRKVKGLNRAGKE